MSTSNRILVLFENLEVERETLQYALALARRTDARLIVLSLIERDPETMQEPFKLQSQAAATIFRKDENIVLQGVPVRFEVRIGDRVSEFYKFMAGQRGFSIAVWGGSSEVLKKDAMRTAAHWLAAVRDDLPATLVTPRRKQSEQERETRTGKERE